MGDPESIIARQAPPAGESPPTAYADYEDWTDLLSWYFFKPENARQPVTLYVSDEVLATITGGDDPGAAVESLVRAVKTRLGSEARDDLFSRIVLAADDWQRKGYVGPPPSIPLLAVAVLAAAHMARDGHVAEHNYYVRFREVLGLPGRGMPSGYDWAFPWLWTQLHGWLDDFNAGKLGRSTVTTHPTFRYIGYALSQALFRASDRHRLTYLFSYLGLVPGAAVDASTLLARFRAWSASAGGLSPGARRLAEDTTYEPMLRSILETAAEAWDGQEVDEVGVRTEPVRVFASFAPFAPPALAFYARRPGGSPEETRALVGGVELHLRSTLPSWYDECTEAVTDSRLSESWVMDSEHTRWAWQGRTVMPLAIDAELGGWTSEDHVIPGAEHCLLVRDDVAPIVEAYLTANGVAGWGVAAIARPQRWRMFRGVVLQPGSAAPEDPRLAPLWLPLRIRLEVHGGLPVAARPPTFLRGAEPDVWLPESWSPESGMPLLDGDPLPVADAERIVSLRGRDLAAGTHTFQVGAARLTLEFADAPLTAPAAVGAIGQCIVEGVARPVKREECGKEIAAGAVGWPLIPDKAMWRVGLTPGTRQAVMFGTVPGQVREIAVLDGPTGLDEAGLTPSAIETEIPFKPAFLLERRSGGWRIRAVSTDGPEVGYVLADATAVHMWAAWLVKAARQGIPAELPTLAAFVDLARGMIDDER